MMAEKCPVESLLGGPYGLDDGVGVGAGVILASSTDGGKTRADWFLKEILRGNLRYRKAEFARMKTVANHATNHFADDFIGNRCPLPSNRAGGRATLTIQPRHVPAAAAVGKRS